MKTDKIEEDVEAEMCWINSYLKTDGITEKNLREMAIEIIESKREAINLTQQKTRDDFRVWLEELHNKLFGFSNSNISISKVMIKKKMEELKHD